MERTVGLLQTLLKPFRRSDLPTSTAQIIPRAEHCITRNDISDNALKVLYRLSNAGFEAYLVGGGVRDLLLRHQPKDFDVATNAKPNQIKKLFRNCRLIGRRFRLAHIHFGREIIEVSTFRALPKKRSRHHQRSDTGMIIRDNVFGDLRQDAWRRDFTINALYYNIKDFSVVDHTGGMADIYSKTLRIIGDPAERYQEDPVRLLRAIRFAAKLDFTLEQETDKQLRQSLELLENVPPARLFEEINKLFLFGFAEKTFRLLREYRLLDYLLPQTASALSSNAFQSLLKLVCQNTDDRVHRGRPVTPAFLYAALLWPAVVSAHEKSLADGHPFMASLDSAIRSTLKKQHSKIAIPKRFTLAMREIWVLQFRFERRVGNRPFRLLTHPRFRAAYDFFALRSQVGDVPEELVTWWQTFQQASPAEQKQMVNEQQKNRPPQRRRRK